MAKTNVTLSLEEDLLRRARMRALERGTSVNEVIRRHLEEFAGEDRRARAMDRFLARAARSTAGTPGMTRTWTRDELYDE